MKIFSSIKTRLILGIMGTSLLIFLILEFVVYFQNKRLIYKNLDSETKQRASHIADYLKHDGMNLSDLKGDYALYDEFYSKKAKSFFDIRGLFEKKIWHSSKQKYSDGVIFPYGDEYFLKKKHVSFSAELADKDMRIGVSALQMPAAIKEKFPKDGFIIITVGVDRSDADKNLRELAEHTSISLALGLALLALTAYIVIYVNLKPLKRLEAEVKAISPKTFTPVSGSGAAEIGVLSGAINEMLDRLKKSYENEKRFTSDVAHELRTPITEMRTLIEVVKKFNLELSESEKINYDEMYSCVMKMENIIIALLTIARCDTDMQPQARETFDLGEMCLDIFRKYDGEFLKKNVTREANIQTPLLINADKQLYYLVFTNLAANAAQYAPSNSLVSAQLISENGVFNFSISNHAPDLSPQDVEIMFERFWRKNTSRSDSDIHSGLGLSLVKSLCAACGININAGIDGDSILTITLSGMIQNS